MASGRRAGWVLLLLAAGLGAAPLAPWPGGEGVEIGGSGLPADFEPSGAVWHPGLGALLVVGDEGRLARLDADGSNPKVWRVRGDWEAIALRDPDSQLVYLGRERPDGIVEFDLAAGEPTGETWDLSPWLGAGGNSGLEGLTWAEGHFLVGHQGDGRIHRFRLHPGGRVEPAGTLELATPRADLSGLDWNAATRRLYAIHDRPNVLVELRGDGSLVRELSLPGTDQEGIAVVPDCAAGRARVFVAEDLGAVKRYEGYPVECGEAR